MLDIFHSYIPNKFTLCSSKDLINEEIKSLIHRKHSLNQRQRKSDCIDYTSLNALTLHISNAISSSELNYHECLANKLNDPKTAPKTYLTILKTFLNGSKIPLIPPLLVDKNKLVTDFLDKEKSFNNFFTKQCTPISNDSKVPVSINFKTRERLSSLEFYVHDIVKIIRSLDQHKAHDHDEVSIRMITLCDSSILKPLHLIFKTVLKLSHFPKNGVNQI